MKKRLFYIFYLLGFVLVFFVGIEVYLNYILNNPDSCPKNWEEGLISYYRNKDEVFIQQSAQMAKYDSVLFYTLKPGEFIFENREFSTPYQVNSLGLRDDEESLNYPKVVCLGDSYGMGWGVHQEESYAQLLEQELGLKVLNAGISSYATPKEITALDRMRTDSMEYLIIQYCPNDFVEIEQYVQDGNRLVVESEKHYDSLCELVNANIAYYPFRYTIEMLPSFFKKKATNAPAVMATKKEDRPQVNVPKAFIELIRSSNRIPKSTKIYVFTIGEIGFENFFLNDVSSQINQEMGSSLQDRIEFIDFSKALTPEHYFKLDIHLNKSGHELIANTLIEQIRAEAKNKNTKEWFYENGNICIRANYLGKLKNGVTNYYWENGILSLQANYKNGLKNGEEIRFNELGEEVERKFYINDEPQ